MAEKLPYLELPNDTEICMICFIQEFVNDIEATFNAANQTFVVNASGLIVPAYQVVCWELVV